MDIERKGTTTSNSQTLITIAPYSEEDDIKPIFTVINSSQTYKAGDNGEISLTYLYSSKRNLEITVSSAETDEYKEGIMYFALQKNASSLTVVVNGNQTVTPATVGQIDQYTFLGVE